MKQHKDPIKERDAAKVKAAIARGREKTVSEIATEFYDDHIAGLASAKDYKTYLQKYVHDTIGNLPIQQVRPIIIVENTGLKELWKKRYPTAKTVRQLMDQMFEYATDKECFEGRNPASWKAVRRLLPRHIHHVQHHAAVDHREVGQFMHALRTYEDRSRRKTGHTVVASLAEMVALTWVRVSEIRLAQWKEIDRVNKIWNIPSEHRKVKDGKVKRIPITKPMEAILDEMEKLRVDPSNDDAVIFIGPYSKRALADSSVSTWGKLHPEVEHKNLQPWLPFHLAQLASR